MELKVIAQIWREVSQEWRKVPGTTNLGLGVAVTPYTPHFICKHSKQMEIIGFLPIWSLLFNPCLFGTFSYPGALHILPVSTLVHTFSVYSCSAPSPSATLPLGFLFLNLLPRPTFQPPTQLCSICMSSFSCLMCMIMASARPDRISLELRSGNGLKGKQPCH